MIFGKKILGIVAARSNSKRLKNKNILKYKKKMLIENAFESAKKSKFIDDIILSSESEKIIKLAKKIGYTVPFRRPNNLSKDNIGAAKVVLHALQKIKDNYDYVILLQPTSPLRKSKDIDESIVKIVKNNYKTLISIYKSKKKGKFKIKIIDNHFIQRNYNNDYSKKFNYYLNGAIFVSKTKHFLKKADFFSSKTGFYLMPEKRSIDIDYKEDFKKLNSNERKRFN